MFTLIPIAFVSGVLTVFSPCVLPILPLVLSSGIDGKKARVNGVILGLVLSFSVAALFFTAFVSLLGIPADSIRNIAAFLLFIIGVSIFFPIWEKLQVHIERVFSKPVNSSKSGFSGGFVTGVGLGVVWTPCVGPIVAAISTLAAVNEFSIISIALVVSYATGIGLPLWLIARKGSSFTSKLSFFKKNPILVRQVFGIILMLTAMMIYSGVERKLQSWFLDNLPEKWANLATTVEESFNVQNRLKDIKSNPTEEVSESGNNEFSEKEKFDPSKINQGCYGMDCIPSIDNPNFEPPENANLWLNSEDTVFGVNHNGIQRAYPQRIMNWHEVVNDDFDGDPIAITFCPLCGTAMSYRRVVNNMPVEFGVTGKLYNNDLIMYDRTDEQSFWLQAYGEAVTGPAAERGEVLTPIATTTTTWEKWYSKYPSTQVLSRETGYDRDYTRYPYGSYEEDGRILFDVSAKNNRFHSKEPLLGIVVNDTSKAYLLSYIESVLLPGESLEDTVGDEQIVISRSTADEYSFINVKTDEEYVPLRAFWFAWYAFYPNTEVFTPVENQ